MATITLENAHGKFTVSEEALDLAIQKYLPSDADGLRTVMDQAIGGDEGQYDDVASVGEMLIMLADPIQGEIDSAAAWAVRNNAHLGGAGMQSYDTYLGQIWMDLDDGCGPRWVDYARGDEAKSKAWFSEDPQNRRVVDWIDKGRVIFGS